MGRKTGSEYDERTFRYICSAVSRLGYTYATQEFESFGGSSRLRNVIVSIKGEIDSVVVIGSHFDGARLSYGDIHYPAANDNASGVVTNLALLDTLARSGKTTHYSIICAFWDGEESYDGSWIQGSSHFVETYPNPEGIAFYLNLDSVGHDHCLYIRHRGHKHIDSALATILGNNRLKYVPVDMNKSKSGSSDYVSFARAGISYLNFCDHRGDMCEFKSHSEYDIPDAVSLDRLIIHVKNILDII